MSIQNVLTAALFKRDEQGRTVMYPNGVIGRGYVVPDAATEQRCGVPSCGWCSAPACSEASASKS